MEWQNIETAPKDGTCIWLGNQDYIRVGFWRMGGWGDIVISKMGLVDNLHFEPTHWQATPEPPKE